MLYNAWIIPIIAGIFSLFVITAHFTTFHTTTLHIDSADQAVAIANNSKVKKLLPLVIAIIKSIVQTAVPSPIFSVFVAECSHTVFLKNYHLSPRAPP